MFDFLWKKSPEALTREYEESVAHRVRDILTGADHSSHSKRNKLAIKALQKPESSAGIIEILRAMPEPTEPGTEIWQVDEGYGKESDLSSLQSDNSLPNATVAAAVDAVGSTSSAAATATATEATSAGTLTAVNQGANEGDSQVQEAQPTNDAPVGSDTSDPTSAKSVPKTSVPKFRPLANEVSSQAYWWGYEIYIPQEALFRIGSAQDVSTAFIGFMSSVGLLVPAIVPFLGYIAAYVGLEFAVIKAQNEGRGVILASTWLVPVAVVPRAWDFPMEDYEEKEE